MNQSYAYMQILVLREFYEQNGLGERLSAELVGQFEVVPRDLEGCLSSTHSLVCLPVEVLPADFVCTPEFMECLVLVSRIADDPLATKFLNLGCADFILPLYSADYFAAKLRNLARRTEEQIIQRQVKEIEAHCGQTLTDKELRILVVLLKDKGLGVNRLGLIQACWPNTTVNNKTLDTHLFNLRRKIEAGGYEVNFKNARWKLLFTPVEARTEP